MVRWRPSHLAPSRPLALRPRLATGLPSAAVTRFIGASMPRLDGLLTVSGRTSNLQCVLRCMLLITVLLSGCGGASKQDSSACTIARGALPSWARTGFSDPNPSMPHVLGDSGRITAILFGDPLSEPPDKQRSNKILWVARDPGHSELKIHAERDGQVVNSTVQSGPG